MTNNPTDWMAAYQAEQQKRQAQLPILKVTLLDELSRHGVMSVTVTYDGEGDSGQIHEITASNAITDLADLPHAVQQQVEEFAWAVLDVYHSGYENNDGGFGQLTIDVTSRSAELDHNDRVVESVNTTTEV
jgi:hypothetical protein